MKRQILQQTCTPENRFIEISDVQTLQLRLKLTILIYVFSITIRFDMFDYKGVIFYAFCWRLSCIWLLSLLNQ